MKILVIFTGGTIGSRVNNGWISTDATTKYTLIEKFRKNFEDSISFETAEPYFILSENLDANRLNLLINCIDDAVKKDFDGIVITHGTDTLHFSAAAVSHAFANSNIPVVFVSANYPLEDARSNGHANFEGAVRLIQSGIKSGVYISYKNPDGQHFIHAAEKALSFSENDDSIYSMHKKPFGVYENGKITLLNQTAHSKNYKATFCSSPKILVVSATPADSFSYNLYDYNAVLLRPYHSGTLNIENESFRSFLKAAQKKDLPVFLANAPLGTTYETAKEYEALGIIPLPDLSFASVYMKLWARISNNENLKNLF